MVDVIVVAVPVVVLTEEVVLVPVPVVVLAEVVLSVVLVSVLMVVIAVVVLIVVVLVPVPVVLVLVIIDVVHQYCIWRPQKFERQPNNLDSVVDFFVPAQSQIAPALPHPQIRIQNLISLV